MVTHRKEIVFPTLFLTVCSIPTLLASAVIHGTIVERGSGRPLGQAFVRLTIFADDETISESSTDENGEFVFPSVADGEYAVLVSKDGYSDLLPTTAGQRAVTVANKDNHDVYITLLMTRLCVIAGRITDVTGRPATFASVVPILSRTDGRDMRLVPGSPTVAVDDRGDYRLAGLAPGRYLIAVVPRGIRASGHAFAPLYFPGTQRPEKAEYITLRAGETRDSIDFILDGSTTHRVAGRVANVPSMGANKQAAVSIFPARGYAAPLETVMTDAEGRFQFPRVPSNVYELVASGPVRAQSGFGPILSNEAAYGRRNVEVVAEDVNDIEISLRAGVPAEGRLTFADAAETSCFPGASISLEPMDPTPSSKVLIVGVDSRGAFGSPAVAPARYRISFRPARNGCFLKEIRYGEEQIAPGNIVTLNGRNKLNVILSTQSAEISGTVYSGDAVVPGSAVVIAPVDSGGELGADRSRVVVADRKGSYRSAALAPGSYRLFATREVTSNHYLNPLFWAEHMDQTPEVVLKPSGNAHVDLAVIKPREGWQ